MRTDSKRFNVIATVLVFAFFIFTMVHGLMNSALWGDEWVEYTYSTLPISTGEFYRSVSITFQPPLYNLIMHVWLAIRSDLLWFRLFNVFIGAGAGVFLYFTVKKLYSQAAALISLAVLACSYQWVFCTQECSEYTLMVFMLFGAVFFFTEIMREYSAPKVILFILFNVGAIYSQYGSVFVSGPMLVILLIHVLAGKDSNGRRRVFVLISYVVSAAAFALPLYVFFLKKQMENNALTHAGAELSPALFKDFLWMPGRLLGYLFSFENNFVDFNEGNLYAAGSAANVTRPWHALFAAAGIVMLVLAVVILIKKRNDMVKRTLLITFLAAYAAHYILVKLRIYAMIHADMSLGFYSRYSYFYIPLFAAVLPVIFIESYSLFCDTQWKKGIYTMLMGAGIMAAVVSFGTTLENWHKSYDDVFAQTWIEHEGYEDMTVLVGKSPPGFNWYVSHSEAYRDGYLDKAVMYEEGMEMPDRFWVWRTNWAGNVWQKIVEEASEDGYEVNVIYNEGYAGQLAFCSRSAEQ